ncbi:hypothetical protein [Desulforamulus ferrireducens]|uniref:Uncharacterized protein n=1 Tax=Desulforamulus ferrireducens TaxID=1833852 RepID=A0A1S6IYR6_9FIRM|nr:hypothetical protein [Desulforamulus ferrireducens]AQS59915.1 hypothetical protein B0537_13005 [Desulforamulus ferrireducens]
MTCYLKNLTPVLKKAGLTKLSPAERKAVDHTIRALTGAKGKCPEVWPLVKAWLAEPGHEELLVKEITEIRDRVEPCP